MINTVLGLPSLPPLAMTHPREAGKDLPVVMGPRCRVRPGARNISSSSVKDLTEVSIKLVGRGRRSGLEGAGRAGRNDGELHQVFACRPPGRGVKESRRSRTGPRAGYTEESNHADIDALVPARSGGGGPGRLRPQPRGRQAEVHDRTGDGQGPRRGYG